MLAAGGNAIDAAIATLFTLTVVEPMMVGIIGGGMAHIRLADGSHRFIDGQSTVPSAVRPDTYKSKPGSAHDVFDTVGDENLNGPKAVAVPGSLKAWCETLQRFGTMSLADVMQPAIKHAARGYAATPYLHECISDGAAEMLKDKPISAIYLPKGVPLKAGERVVQAEYAETLSYISQHGEAALYQGPLGDILVDYMKANGGFIAREDLTGYKTVERQPIRADYRGWEILGPPPPAASGVHIAQMLNILEGYDIAELGFGTARDHPLPRRGAEDRLCRSRGRKRRSRLHQRAGGAADLEGLCRGTPPRDRPGRAQPWGAGVAQLESAHTTHMTAADAFGNVVATTQTINNLFGAKILIPGLGTVPNNYMNLYDPRPGHALSLAPGKRVTTSMSPMMALRDGKLRLCARPARRKADLSERDAGADQSDRSWHEPAGSGRGAAGLDRGQCARGRTRRCRKACAPNSQRWATGCGGADGGRRHERDPVPRRRPDVGRGLLARRRHADRHGRRPRARGRAVRAGVRRCRSPRRRGPVRRGYRSR